MKMKKEKLTKIRMKRKMRAKIVKMVEKKKKSMVCAFDLQWQKNVWLWIVVGEVGLLVLLDILLNIFFFFRGQPLACMYCLF